MTEQLAQNNLKKRQGRWSEPEHQKFLLALDRYGANWKKMKHLFENRQLSQIRSHAQKHFQKTGTKERIKYQRKAKLLEADQIKAIQEQQNLEYRLKSSEPKIQTKLQNGASLPIENNEQKQVNFSESILQEQLVKEQQCEFSETITPYNTLLTNSDKKSNIQQSQQSQQSLNSSQNHGYLFDIFKLNPNILNYYGINCSPSFCYYN